MDFLFCFCLWIQTKGLDFVVSEAKRYGIKLILSLVNNYENFGGKKQYVDWARSQGQNLASDADFFTNSVVKGYYKNHIKTVLTRRNSIAGVEYKDDPTIMAWEQMALYLKSIDSNHLLEAGLEGFYGQTASQKQQFHLNFQVGTDFIANNQILGIDFATIHSYPDVWQVSEQNVFWGRKKHPLWKSHFLSVSLENHGKIRVLTQQRDILFKTVYSAIYSSASGGGAAAGGMFWQLLTEGTASLIAQQSQKLQKIRKMYVRLRNVEIWRKARDMNKRGNTGN
ncbi:Mannan endo-1,4-beta-mannosidase 7 [Camellia lanceoleosa]|uniref:Mannan endo-1,4-beta-mannosidase 7 n=1 Tax=Camellia lanceoleosa TaxID=1840588 RepID=A0ACC0HRZ9_9ERIC|nr:Mannan endo-1,4-beta-mannosidase 7 [Camellia lanceoleosa]